MNFGKIKFMFQFAPNIRL